MTPAYFAEQPEASLPKKPSAPNRISAKKLAARIAAGERFISRTVSPSKKAPKPRAKKRERNDGQRIYGPETFRDFLHAQPCLNCGIRYAIEQAHMRTGGVGRKDDFDRTGPLCGPHVIVTPGIGEKLVEGCHRDYDRYRLSNTQRAAVRQMQQQFWNRWLLHCGRLGLDPHTGQSAVRGGER